eukprot:364287-Chlamydomonas_euryale.AAC.6
MGRHAQRYKGVGDSTHIGLDWSCCSAHPTLLISLGASTANKQEPHAPLRAARCALQGIRRAAL